jgi:hypothetical protein
MTVGHMTGGCLATASSLAARGGRALLATLLAMGSLLLLAGCAAQLPIRADVTAFHQWQGEPPLTFSFRRTTDQLESLEHRSYEDLVAARLVSLGFEPVADAAAARYHVALRYSTSTQTQQRVEYPFHPAPFPAFHPAFHPGLHPGFWGPGPFGYGPFFPHDPWLWGPPMPLVRDVTWVTHLLRVDLFDTRGAARDGPKVWEASSTVSTPRMGLPEAMPVLVTALFDGFPGPAGRTRQVSVARAAAN